MRIAVGPGNSHQRSPRSMKDNQPWIPNDLIFVVVILFLIRPKHCPEGGLDRVILCPGDVGHIVLVSVDGMRV